MAGLGGGAEMCTMDAITFTASLLGREVLMHTPPSRARQMAQRMQALGIKPEWEAFTHNHLLQDARTLIAAGFDRPPYCFNICVGLDRIFQGALPWTPRLLQSMVDELPPQSVFNVSAIGPDHVHAITHALLLGGHIRVGLEDCLFYAPDEPATNVRMVERAVRLVRELGFELATPAEARAILGLEARHG
jgi:uncharacterized protein (DUF849 family)